jgi:actin
MLLSILIKRWTPVLLPVCWRKDYELPDGQVITIGNERFRCVECLFQPSLLGIEATGIQHMIFDTVRACPSQLVHQLYTNIVLAGGSTMFPGLAERLTKELQNELSPSPTLSPLYSFKGDKSCLFGKIPHEVMSFMALRYGRANPKIIPPERKYSTWIGGSILSSLPSFQSAWITKANYDECGPRVVHRMCY